MHHDSTQNPPANRMAHNEDAQRLRAFQEENARLRAEVEALRNASNPRVNPAEQQHPQQHPPPQVIEAASDLRAPQQVEAGAAAAAATINQAPTRQALYEDEATVARIRESLAARKEEEDARKPQLPDIIPGFKANALNLAAAKAAEERTRHHHGNARADALASHHLLVTDLGRLHGWEIALEYDRQQWDLWARYPSHDISTLDRDALTIIATQYLVTNGHKAVTSSSNPTKRLAETASTQPTTRKRPRLCFRCGFAGHMPADCKAESTSAGQPVAPFSSESRSKNTLLAPNNKPFCFNFAKDSYCPFKENCRNYHDCSLCGCRAATFDISAAYRLTPIRPDQQNALCILWDGKVRVDRAVMFGMASSAGVFGCVADMLVDIYKAAGFGPLIKWVDDFFVVQLPGATWTEEDFTGLTAAMGVPWSAEKIRPLAQTQRYIGFDWHLHTKSVSLPTEKVTKLKDTLQWWLTQGVRVLASEAASLHGKLIHISSIFRLIRPFLPALARFAQSFRSHRARLRPPPSVTGDIRWVLDLLNITPNEIPLMPPEPTDIDWWGDASTSFGIGVTVGSLWAVWQWKEGIKIGPKQRFDIAWAEAVAVELALRLALEAGLLHPGHYLVRSDNSGVVAVLNAGRARNREVNEPSQRHRRLVEGGYPSLPDRVSKGQNEDGSTTSPTPFWLTNTVLAFPILVPPCIPSTTHGDFTSHHSDIPCLRPSPLRPACRAEERLFHWKGVNTPPPSTIDHPTIKLIADIASRASLRDTKSYGSGLRKFHIFCDTFSIPEHQRLPASYELLHSFALWAVTDPNALDPSFCSNIAFEPVSVPTIRKYLSAIRAWHIAQGWPEPLSESDQDRIDWSLRGLQNIFGKRSRPVRPPITIPMLRALKRTLNLNDTFDACVWAMAACAFWGMMRFGEVSVKSRKDFSGDKHLKRRDAFLGRDLDGRRGDLICTYWKRLPCHGFSHNIGPLNRQDGRLKRTRSTLSPHLLMAYSGESDLGDTIQFAEYVERNICLYQIRNLYALRPAAAASWIRRAVAESL
ncbi:unnamed protein product [Cyclocybe aegerita]|uniref:Uncharacterized protein n=1 Tax=Cyclocybe aegerita TaxID=1973307 RepID=A0A8S0XS66_CYCAE|nr:unnamed protein product [Cyclocybe aegerita]